MKRCHITITLDVTPNLPDDWRGMSLQDLKEWFTDTPEIIFNQENQLIPNQFGDIIRKVEKVNDL